MPFTALPPPLLWMRLSWTLGVSGAQLQVTLFVRIKEVGEKETETLGIPLATPVHECPVGLPDLLLKVVRFVCDSPAVSMILLRDLSWHDAKAKVEISGCGLKRAWAKATLSKPRRHGKCQGSGRESQLWAGGSMWRGLGLTLTLGVGKQLLTFANQRVYALVSHSWTR